MTRKIFAQEITKEYLKKLGIEYVSPDGKYVIKNGMLAHISVRNKDKRPYGYVHFLDPDISSSIYLGIHVLNYVWNNADKPEGMVIDHIDNDSTNNDISNLQCITQRENVAKEKEESNKRIECQLHKPRSFYENKLIQYEALFEAAKKEHNSDLCRKLSSNIYHTKARLRYWDSHKEEYYAYLEANAKDINDKQIWRLRVKLRKHIEDKKKSYKEKGNLKSWHACCQLAKEVNEQPADKILEICEKLGIKLDNAE